MTWKMVGVSYSGLKLNPQWNHMTSGERQCAEDALIFKYPISRPLDCESESLTDKQATCTFDLNEACERRSSVSQVFRLSLDANPRTCKWNKPVSVTLSFRPRLFGNGTDKNNALLPISTGNRSTITFFVIELMFLQQNNLINFRLAFWLMLKFLDVNKPKIRVNKSCSVGSA